MINLSEVVIVNLDNRIYALIYFNKKPSKYTLLGDVKSYQYIYRDVLDGESGKEYIFYHLLKPINPITYYMTEEEIVEYLNRNNSLNDFNSFRVIARAIKYEQEKLYKDEQDNIKKLIK